MTVGPRPALKAAINAAGKTQRQIAVDANIPENRLSDFVRGWATPSVEEETRLMQAIGCSSRVFDPDYAVIETRSVR